MTAIFFPCPDCGEPTTVRANYPRYHDTVRYRLCAGCDWKFRTVQVYGQPEQYDGEPEEAEPEPELEPLDLEAIDPVEDRRERLRALFLWCKGVAATRPAVRPAALRGGNGYDGQSDSRLFYRE